MLHICTISFNTHLLSKVRDSIPNSKDICWHICTTKDKPYKRELENTIIYELDCHYWETPIKMNYIFDQIKDLNGYFCILDDDTKFHQGMLRAYYMYKNKEYMVIGRQVDKNYITRLQSTLPYECAIDSGNVLCHTKVLQKVRWPEKHWDEEFHADFDFWNKCFKEFGIQNTDLIQNTVSIYNYYNDKPDTLNYVR